MKYLAIDTQAEVKLAETLEERPDDVRVAEGPGLERGPALQDVHETSSRTRTRGSSRSPRSARHGRGPVGRVHRQVGGGAGAGSPGGLQQLAIRSITAAAGLSGRRTTAMPSSDRGDPTPARRKARRRRRRRTASRSCAFLSPWIIGFSGSTSIRCSRACTTRSPKYDAILPTPRGSGLSTTGSCSRTIRTSGSRCATRLDRGRVGIPLQIVFAIGCALRPDHAAARRSAYRRSSSCPTMVPAVAAALAFLFLLNPFGPIDTILRFLHLPPPLWFQDPRGPSRASCCSGCGGSAQR